ncbi:MAG: hypothetical protein WA130_13230 [Candidatus Methanoperedens sp.]
MINSLLILQVTNQPPPRQTVLRDFLIGVLENVYTRIIAILTFIYLIIQFLAILGIIPKPYGIVQEPYRSPTILIAIGLLSIFVYYYIFVGIYKFMKLLAIQIKTLTAENDKLKMEFKEKNIPKDPSKLINDHLAYPDVKFAIYALSKKIDQTPNFFVRDANGRYDTQKNIIIGIDRGGAIVGGLLAKNLGLAIKTLAINYANPPQILQGQGPENIRVTSIITGKCLDNIDFDSVTNILLVDDAIRNGFTMLSARTMLDRIINEKNKLGQIRIKEACILYQQAVSPLIRLPEFYVYQTNIVRIWLPWDTTRQALLPIGEEKRLFEDLYMQIQNVLIPTTTS